jgi:hypothetical protein
MKLLKQISIKNAAIAVYGGWIMKGGATSDKSRTPARGPLFGPNILP